MMNRLNWPGSSPDTEQSANKQLTTTTTSVIRSPPEFNNQQQQQQPPAACEQNHSQQQQQQNSVKHHLHQQQHQPDVSIYQSDWPWRPASSHQLPLTHNGGGASSYPTTPSYFGSALPDYDATAYALPALISPVQQAANVSSLESAGTDDYAEQSEWFKRVVQYQSLISSHLQSVDNSQPASVSNLLAPINSQYATAACHNNSQHPTNSQQHTHNNMPAVRQNATTGRKRTGGRRPKEEEDIYDEMGNVDVKKRRERRERNRIAAQRCRQRRIDLISDLEQRCLAQQREIEAKERTLNAVMHEKNELQQLINQHVTHGQCKLPGTVTSLPSISVPSSTSASSVAHSSAAGNNPFAQPMAIVNSRTNATQHHKRSYNQQQQQKAPSTGPKLRSDNHNSDPTLSQAMMDDASELIGDELKDIKPDPVELTRPNTLPFTTAQSNMLPSNPGIMVTTPSTLLSADKYDMLGGQGTGLTPMANNLATPVTFLTNTGTTPLDTPDSKSLANL